MAINKKPVPKGVDPVEEFIKAAPDAADSVVETTKPKYVRKGKKIQITLTISEPLLGRVDDMAQRLSLSRAAIINLAINQGMDRGISVDGGRE